MQRHRIQGLVLAEHEFAVPLDHARPDGETITVFAREARAAGKEDAELPWLVFLQGGPGLAGDAADRARALDPASDARLPPAAARPARHRPQHARARADSGAPRLGAGAGRLPEALSRRLDRARRRDHPSASSPAASRGPCSARATAASARPPISPWRPRACGRRTSRAGCLRSSAPPTRSTAPPTSGSPIGTAATTRATRRMSSACATSSRCSARRTFASRTARRSRPRRLLQVGSIFGMSYGFEHVHYLLEIAFAGDGELSSRFLRELDHFLPFDPAPIYSLLHEACYAQGEATRWSAQRVHGGVPRVRRPAGRGRSSSPARWSIPGSSTSTGSCSR